MTLLQQRNRGAVNCHTRPSHVVKARIDIRIRTLRLSFGVYGRIIAIDCKDKWWKQDLPGYVVQTDEN